MRGISLAYPFLVLIVGIGCSVVLWNALEGRERQHVEDVVKRQANSVLVGIRDVTENRLLALDRMAKRWATAKGTPYGEWLADAANYVQDQPGYQAIEFADQDLVVQWVYPILGNEGIRGLNLSTETRRAVALDLARKHRATMLTKPIDLFQGGKGFLAYSPIIGDEGFMGTIIGVFRTQELLESIIPPEPAKDLTLRIYHEDQPVFEAMEGFYAHHAEYKATATTWIVNTQWRLEAWPSQAFVARVKSTTPLVSMLVGFLVSGLMAALVAAIQTAKSSGARVREREGRLRAIFDTVVDGILTIDGRGKVLTFNPAAERLFGYTADEVVGCNVSMLMPTDVAREHDGYISAYIRTGEAKIIGIGREVVARRKDGSEFPAELSVGETNVDGRRIFTGTLRDITERHKVDRMKREFISTVSHELRTPLTSIMGSLGLLKGGMAGELSPAAMSMIGIAHGNSERLVRLINDILDMEKIEAGQMKMQFHRLNLTPLLIRSMDEHQGFAGKCGVKLELETDGLEAWTDGDSDRLLQIFSNLLSNAIKFSPEGETVRVILTQDNDWWEVAVVDHGCGIPEEFKKDVFRKFQQGDQSDTRRSPGSGLGLSIVKALVDRHQGRIFFESQAGSGTTFRVAFPRRSEGEAKPSAPNVTTPASRPVRASVLVCEDEPDIARLFAEILSNAGFKVVTVGSVSEALTQLAGQEYNALVLDMILPDGNGVEIMDALRRMPQHADLPVVIASATTKDGENGIQTAALGIQDWLEKPVNPERLIHAVSRAVLAVGRSGAATILHVEDDPDVLSVVSGLIQDQAKIVSASSLADARVCLKQERFDLIVLDLTLPDGRGEALIEDIREQYDDPPPIVIFSALDDQPSDAAAVSAVLVKSRTGNDRFVKTIERLLR